MTRFSYAGLIVELSLLLSQFSTFLTPAISQYSLQLASLNVNFFLALLALVTVFVCVLTVKMVPWTGAASIMLVVSLLIFLLVRAFVPPMMTLLVQAEHETYLAQASRIGSTIEALRGQTPVPLLTTLSLDGVAWLARRGRWTLARQHTWSLIAALVSMLLVTGSLELIASLAYGAAISGVFVLGLVLDLALAIPAILLAYWLASTMSETLQALRR